MYPQADPKRLWTWALRSTQRSGGMRENNGSI
jgi:hypothetical protein